MSAIGGSRWAGRSFGRIRPRPLGAAAVAALFAVPACGQGATGVQPPPPMPSIAPTDTTVPPTTTTPPTDERCTPHPGGVISCTIPGRPLRTRLRQRVVLPADQDRMSVEARAEYASVAAFGELALQLLAVGAPAELIRRCHRAAVEEIEHAELVNGGGGTQPLAFGAMPEVLGRRIGRRWTSRSRHLARLAADSYRDGWLNEGTAAVDLAARAATATSDAERTALSRIAADEQSHAELARDIVLWCHAEEPRAVGRALARCAA